MQKGVHWNRQFLAPVIMEFDAGGWIDLVIEFFRLFTLAPVLEFWPTKFQPRGEKSPTTDRRPALGSKVVS